MIDEQVIEKFNQFKKDTEYSDLDLSIVEFGKTTLGKIHNSEDVKTVVPTSADKFLEIGDIDKISKNYNLSKKTKIKLPKFAKSASLGTILISRVRPLLGGFTIIKSNDISFTSGDLFPISCSNEVNNNYVFKVICSKNFDKFLDRNQDAVGQKPVIKRNNLYKFSFSIPNDLNKKYTSLKIQEALVKFIEFYQQREVKQIELLDLIMSKLGEMERLVLPLFFQKDESIKGRFNKYCKRNNTKLSIDDIEFALKRVDKVFDTVRRGASPRPIKDFVVPENYEGEKFGWLKIGDVTSSGMYLNNTKQYINAEGRKKSVLGKKGDFLITNSMTVGIPIILNIETCFHDGFLYLGFDDENQQDYSEFYFYHFFISFREKLKGMSKMGIVSNLNTDIIKEVEIPIPVEKGNMTSIEIQNFISKFFDDFYKSTSGLRDLGENLRKLIQEYTQTLIYKIFNESV